MSIIETPLQLQHLSLKNRIIRSAVHSFLADTDGCMTDAEYDMYETLAKNGVGTSFGDTVRFSIRNED